MKLPPWAALLLILILLTTGKAGRARAGVFDKVRDEARATGSDHDEPDSHEDGGKLERVRKETREERDRDDDRDDRGHRHHRRGRGDAVFTGFWFSSSHHDHHCPPAPCGSEVYTTSGLPPEEYDIAYRATFGDEFAPYPYAPGATGCLTGAVGEGKEWLGHLGLEQGLATDDVDRTGFTLFVEGESGFGANFEWHSLTEDLAGGGHDELHLGELDITYRLVESDHALVRAGLGLNWLGDRYDTDFGVNFTVGADFFPVRPIVLSTELDLGTVGDAQMLHLSGTAGWMMGRMELFGGYDYRRIGDAVIEGPLVGLRLWF